MKEKKKEKFISLEDSTIIFTSISALLKNKLNSPTNENNDDDSNMTLFFTCIL